MRKQNQVHWTPFMPVSASLISVICLPVILLLASCDSSPLGAENFNEMSVEEMALVDDDKISGLYELSGSRIITMGCFGTCYEDYVPEIDTIQVSFDLEIHLITSVADSAYIISLEEDQPGPVGSMPDVNDGRIYLSDSEIQYDFFDTGSSYRGEGEISEGQITLSTYSHRRGYEIRNELTGTLKKELLPFLR